MDVRRYTIHTGSVKLESLLRFGGYTGTMSYARELITSGAVSVNGEVCKDCGRRIYDGDTIAFEDIVINAKEDIPLQD